LVLGTGSQAVGLEAPRHLELAEVGGVDLIERGVLGPAHVRRVMRPIASRRRRQARGAGAILARHSRGDTKQHRQAQEPQTARHRPLLMKPCVETQKTYVVSAFRRTVTVRLPAPGTPRGSRTLRTRRECRERFAGIVAHHARTLALSLVSSWFTGGISVRSTFAPT